MYTLKWTACLLFLLGVSHSNAFLNLVKLDETVLAHCYERDLNNDNLYIPKKIPWANSLDNFLYFLEKLEETYRPSEVIELLLKRFTILNLELGAFPKQNRKRMSDNREVLITDFLVKYSRVEFDEGILKDDEKCSLFFMMTHYFQNISRQSTELEERGVIGIDSLTEPSHAIALYKVILGIHAGLTNQEPLTLLKVMQKYSYEAGAFDDVPINERIDKIYSITLGDYLSYAAIKLIDNNFNRLGADTLYGENFKFNNPQCFTEYNLPNEPELFTLSELRGALDGYIIGQEAAKLEKDGMTISDMLRIYYKPNTNREKQQFSYCDRRIKYDGAAGSFELNLKLHVYMLEVIEKPHYTMQIIEQGVRQTLEDFTSKFEDMAYNIFNDKDSKCLTLSRSTSAFACDMENDLFFVLNRRTNIAQQLDIINNVVNSINIGEGRGSVSVIINTRGQFNSLLNITNAGEVGCTLNQLFNQSTSSSVINDEEVLQVLNNTLRNHKEKTREYGHVPGRAIIYFAYQKSSITPRSEEIMRDINNYHSEIPIFLIGDNAKNWDTQFRKSTIVRSGSAIEISNELKKLLCTTSLSLQYPECNNPQQSESYYNYEGFIAPDHQQFIAMYPEYFHRSYTMKFTFETEASRLKICYTRDRMEELNNEVNCKYATPMESMYWEISNPCRKESVQSCRPLYFAISSREPATSLAICTEKSCKRPDEAKFIISHENVRCSKAWNIPSSPLFIVFAAFLATSFKLL